MANFRDAAWALSPARLRTSKAAKMVYTFIGLPLDMIAESARQAVHIRFPDDCPEDALPYLSRDRGIRRGPLESSASIRARLRTWIATWRAAGVGRSMLDQIAAFLTPDAVRLRIWTQTGVIYTREADGSFAITRAPAGLWNWDARPDLWARFWLLIDSIDGVPWTRDGTWGDGELWGDSLTSTWGSTATSAQVQTIRGIVDDWKPAASVCKNIVVVFDAAAFSAGDASPPLPDGTWGHWGKIEAGVMVPARDDRAIYWDGA